MMQEWQKVNLQEPQRNRNATANFVNLIRTSTVSRIFQEYVTNNVTCMTTMGLVATIRLNIRQSFRSSIGLFLLMTRRENPDLLITVLSVPVTIFVMSPAALRSFGTCNNKKTKWPTSCDNTFDS